MRINEVVRTGLDIDADMLLGKRVHQLFNEIIDTARWITRQKQIAQITDNREGLEDNIQLLNELMTDYKELIQLKHSHLVFTAEYINDPAKQKLLQQTVTKMTSTVNREINKSKKDPK